MPPLAVLKRRDPLDLFKKLAKIAFVFKADAARNLPYAISLLQHKLRFADSQLDQKLMKGYGGIITEITVQLGAADKKVLRHRFGSQIFFLEMLGHIAHDTVDVAHLVVGLHQRTTILFL